MHLQRDDLSAYLDGELAENEIVKIEGHLQGCSPCRQRLIESTERKDQIGARLALLRPNPNETPLPAHAAYRLLEGRVRKEQEKMWLNRILQPRFRPLAIVGLLLLIVLVAFAFPQVRVAANNFLGLFRIQQVAIVEVNPANLPEQLGSSRSFEQVLTENVTFTENGEPVVVADKAAASVESGLAVRLPDNADEAAELIVQPGADISFDVDLGRITALLIELGYEDLEVPQELDGETVSLRVPPSVMASYGECDLKTDLEPQAQRHLEEVGDCTVLVQMNSPSISAPEGLDLAAIGTAFLQIMGLSEAEAEQFSQTVDWTTTLVIPIPRYGVTYEEVDVDGVTGTMIYEDEGYRRPNYMLIWVRDEVVYALSGPGRGAEGLQLANSMK